MNLQEGESAASASTSGNVKQQTASPSASTSSPTSIDQATQTSEKNHQEPTALDDGKGPSSIREEAIKLKAALARAQSALDKAESSLESLDALPSAQPLSPLLPAFFASGFPFRVVSALGLVGIIATASTPGSNLHTLLSVARSVATVSVMFSALVASHAFGILVQWILAAVGGISVALWGLRKGSLSRSGALAAAAVGGVTLGCSMRFGATLLAFFFSSSKLTQYKEEVKELIDDQAKKGGQRDWVQVFCNALIPTIFAATYGWIAGCVDVPLGPLACHSLEPWRSQVTTALMGGFLGYYACCCGDTWASELGPLSTDTPRLITTMQPVRKGTNGGVTLLGLSASIFGGAFIGAVFYAAAVLSPTLFVFEQQHSHFSLAIEQWKLIPLGLVAGLLGSVLDSLLGATLQFSGYDPSTGRVTSKSNVPGVQHISGRDLLGNNMVNLASASLTSILTALAALKTFY